MIKKNIKNRCGQNLLEYSIILGVTVMIFIVFMPLIKRGTQGMIKTVADQIGNQKNAEQDFNEETGYLYESFQATDTRTRKNIGEGRLKGVTDIFYDDRTSTFVSSNSIAGFARNGVQ